MHILLFVVFYYLHSELFSLSVSTEQNLIVTHFLESNATSAFFQIKITAAVNRALTICRKRTLKESI